jgi:threonine synthase
MAAVTDPEIIEGMKLLARTEGIFTETAGGVTIATLKKLTEQGVIRPDECVVAYVTGHGLKTLEALTGTVGPTATIPPTIDAFTSAFNIDEE